MFLHNKLKAYKEMKDRGILFQMNLLSLGDFYGKDVQQNAMKLLDEGLINFVGSDVHNMDQLNGLKEVKVSINCQKPCSP